MWISYFKSHLDVVLQIDRSRSSGGVERTDFICFGTNFQTNKKSDVDISKSDVDFLFWSF